MTESGITLPAPAFHKLTAAVLGYAAGVYIVAMLTALATERYFGESFLQWLFIAVPSLFICLAIAFVGLILADYAQITVVIGVIGFPSPKPPPPPSVFLRALGIALAVVAVIVGAFVYSHAHPSASRAMATGLASALACGLSVVGSLIWNSLGVVSSIYWASWFNLFAACFAALAVGFAPG